MATVIQEFKGVADGEHRTRTFRNGDTVTGDLARVAVAEGWARDDAKKPIRKKAESAKSGAVSRRGQASRKSSASKSDT